MSSQIETPIPMHRIPLHRINRWWFVIIAMLVAGSFYLGTRTSAKVQGRQTAAPIQTGERITGRDKQHKFSFFCYKDDGQAPEGLREAAEKRDQGTQQVDATFKPVEDQISIGWGEKYTYIQGLEQQGQGFPVFILGDNPRGVLVNIDIRDFGSKFVLGPERAIGVFDEAGEQIGYFEYYSEEQPHTITVRQVPHKSRK